MATILVVDDDEHIREFLRKSLSNLMTVVEAADGAQAVAAARWSKPQIVVMDLEMPVLDGYEAARQIKADPATGNPQLIALTGAEATNAVPRARAAGFSYFVRKEVNARVFVEKIVRLVESNTPPEPPAQASAPEPAPAPSVPDAPAPAKRARKKRAGKARAARRSPKKGRPS